MKNPYLDDPDVQLMLAFKNGDKSAFDKLLTQYFKRVLNFIYRYLGNKEIAEDLTQEVFIRIYHAAPRYQPASKFQTWAFTIAKNLAFNEQRKNKGYFISSINADIQTQEGHVPYQIEDANAALPGDNLMSEERAQTVKDAIDSLPAAQRMAVILRRYENFSYEEIAKTMKISEKAVKSLLNRAKENLKDRLKGLMK